MYRERNIFRFLLLFILCLFITNTSAKCFGKSCTGWECHCSNTAVDQCPIRSRNTDGALTCPNPNSACESTIKTPYPWTPPGWTGPACQIGNVARGKTVAMSSILRIESDYRGSKCTDGQMVSGMCHTKDNQDAWIRIDLGAQYVVHEVTPWDRRDVTGCTDNPWNSWKKRSRNLEIRVGDEYGNDTSISTSNQKCAYHGLPPLCGTHKTLACSPGPIVGRYVTVQHKNIGYAESLALAEIEVIGFKYIAPGDCSKGSNSFGCMIECRCYNSESCNYLSGICESGCSQNYIGKWCESELKSFSQLTKSALTDNSVKVRWRAYSGSVVDSGRGTVSVQYLVVYRKISEKTWTNQETAGVLTHRTITGLTPNTGYKIAVRLQKIVNNQLISTASLTSTVLTLCADPLNGPKGVRVVSTAVENSNTWPQTTNLILTWTTLTAAELQCDVTKAVYQVEYKQLNRQTWTTKVAQPTGLTLTGLEPYTDYEVRVGVKNDVTQKFIYTKPKSYKTSTAVICFGKSCTGWECHCSNTALNVCPIKGLNVDGALTCPNHNTACESTIKTPYPWTPPGWTGPACQIGNVARGKTVAMSSILRIESDYHGSKCTDGQMVSGMCHTKDNQDAWIRIDLGAQYVVHEVTPWDRRDVTGCTDNPWNSWKKRSRNLEIRVGDEYGNDTSISTSNQKCAYHGLPPLCGTHKTLACSPGPIVGRYVTVQHKNISNAEYLALAEIEVIGFKYIAPGSCSKGSNSFGCMIECYPCYNNSESCNYLSGICESGCSQNYIGKWCESEFKLFSQLTKYALTDNIVRVGWTAYSGSVVDSGRGTVSVQYQVVYSKISENTWTNQETAGVLTHHTITGLTPNTKYEIAVRLQKLVNGQLISTASLTSQILNIQTLFSVPGPPASLDFSFTRDTLKTTLTWTPPNSPNGDIISYRLTCEPISTTSTTPLSDIKTINKPKIKGSITTFDIRTSLISFTQYKCTIFASNSIGEGSPASVRFWTGKITIPHLVVKKAAVTDTTVTLQITRVNTGNITGYEVIVKKHDGPINRRRRRSINQSQYVSYGEAKQRGLSVYITAVLPPEVPSEFTVGDTRNYSGYFNAPLETGKSYSFILGIIENYNGETFRHYPPIEQQERITVNAPSSNAWIIGGVVAAVLILLLVAVVLFIVLRRGGFKTKETSSNEVGMEIVSPSGKSIGKPLARLKGNPRRENKAHANSTLSIESCAYYSIYDDPNTVYDTQDDEDHHYDISSKGATMICDLLGETLMKTSDEWKNMNEEFQSVLKLRRGLSDCAEKVENLAKNRFPDILAYDLTRVVLEQTSEDQTSDYVNANYIRGLTGHVICIACQAPLPSTINDHWRMIWQEKCPAIIVLTDLTEGHGKDKKVKCHLYWPTKLDAIGRYGDITVTVAEKMEKHTEPPAVVHFLSITKRGLKQAHNLIVFHYRGWPDHGVPFPASSVVRMQQFIKQRLTDPDQGLVLIHGSAGAGRTGCYIATEQLLEKAKKDGLVNVFDMTRKLRQQRPEMIQNMKQYILVHQILLEELVLGPVAYPTTSFRESYEERKAMRPVSRNVSDKIEEQFLVLKASTPIQDEESLAVAKLLNNVSKSRYKDILPEAQYQPQLSHKGFINASFVHTITDKNVFIATQSPMANTFTDFWQMIFDYNCEIIVMMHQEYPQDPTYASYWPAAGSIKCSPFTITVEEVSLPCKTIVRRDLILQKQNESHQIRQIQFLGWPEDESVPDLQHLFEFVNLVTREHVTSPIVVHCMDSTTRAGLFCAAFELITKAPSSEQIDIYHCIQKLRMTRPQFIPNLEQYKFLHDLVIFYLQGFDTYVNLS
ncbi:receptor-type tyrosine-protein phosphatase T-like isoform X2 [Tubulanus polymorphus]|uniref:receptor-type tyrosine-protein phosphatase T-like isoform X2 n=1 Tax=Tubulanus polymorphus TaxID=672921 RepID=UPI003DA4EB59